MRFKLVSRGEVKTIMHLIILMVGKTRATFIQKGLEFYCDRLKFYGSLELLTVREEKPHSGLTGEQIMEKEGERLLARVPSRPG
jgi:23S rRNA pseudoU1915 N3-methylase RlmH